MPSINRFPPYVIVAAALFMITFYYVYNVRKENSDLERNVKIYSEALSVSKEKNKVLVKDAREKIEKKDARINELEKENLTKHTRLGVTQTKLAKMKEQLALKQDEIKKLHELAINHKSEIATLSKSVSKSKEVLTKLSVKADHLMLDHKKLKKENTQLQEQNVKLENEIKQHKSEKKTLEDQVDVLTKEKQDLSEKIKYLKKRNDMISESIKQKIKESYAARRTMTQRKPVASSVKETNKDEETNLRTSLVSAQNINITKDERKDSSKDTPPVLINDSSVVKQNLVSNVAVDNSNNTRYSLSRLMVDNSGKTRHNISKFMLDNRSGTLNNVSKVLVDNSESRERRDANSDAFVAKTPTRANNDVLSSEEPINASTAQDTPDSEVIDAPQRYSHSLNADKFKSENITEDQTLADVPPEIVTSKGTSENLNEEDDVENLEENTENENVNTQSLIEGESDEKSEVDAPETRTGNKQDTLPTFPKIEDDTIEIQPQREYGNHLQNNFQESTVSHEET